VIDSITVRYALVGFANTAAGFGCILLFQYGLGMPPVASNGAGFAFGLSLSYFLNRRFAFKSDRTHAIAVPAFLVSAALSFVLNLVVLQFALSVVNLSKLYAQVFAVASYTLCFYLLNRYVVFARAKS
jgi:putative flippase GtrA